MRELSALELNTYLRSCESSPLLLDVRQPWEFDVCKIDNSVLLPMAQVPERIETLDSTREIVVICHHGIRSRKVGHFLKQSGFDKIINLSGGVDQWAKTVDQKMSTY
jgi:rhodanese-related sulfurtransferase